MFLYMHFLSQVLVNNKHYLQNTLKNHPFHPFNVGKHNLWL